MNYPNKLFPFQYLFNFSFAIRKVISAAFFGWKVLHFKFLFVLVRNFSELLCN